jgi:hypothetical protein
MQRVAVALATLALVIGVWNAWSLHALSVQLGARPHGPAGVADGPLHPPEPVDNGDHPLHPPEPVDDGDHPVHPGPGPAEDRPVHPPPTADDDGDPAFQAKVADAVRAEQDKREDERRQRMDEQMQNDIEEFAADENLDDKTIDALEASFSARSAELRDIRSRVRDGALSWTDARTQMATVRDKGERETEALIGEDRAEKLLTKMFGDRRGAEAPR